jgi:hypothetical protein
VQPIRKFIAFGGHLTLQNVKRERFCHITALLKPAEGRRSE